MASPNPSPRTSTSTTAAASTTNTPVTAGASIGKEEKDKKILMQLFTGDLDVASIQKVLRTRNIAFRTGLRKPVLAELLRVNMEADLSLDGLIRLRSQELELVQQGKLRRSSVISRLSPSGDSEDTINLRDHDLAARLRHRLQEEIATLKEQQKIQSPLQQDKGKYHFEYSSW